MMLTRKQFDILALLAEKSVLYLNFKLRNKRAVLLKL